MNRLELSSQEPPLRASWGNPMFKLESDYAATSVMQQNQRKVRSRSESNFEHARRPFYGGLVPNLKSPTEQAIASLATPLQQGMIAKSQDGIIRTSSTNLDAGHESNPNPQSDEKVQYSAIELILGRNEIGCMVVLGAAITELNATCIFMYFHIGIILVASRGGWSYPPLVAAIGHFILIALLIFTFAAPSGAHFNPNTTFATVLIGHTTVYRYVNYAVAQLLGAILGVVLMRATLGWDGVSASTLGACGIGSLSTGSAVVVMIVIWHTLFCVIGGIAFSEQQASRNSRIQHTLKLPLFAF